jgi:hypothetical protein
MPKYKASQHNIYNKYNQGTPKLHNIFRIHSLIEKKYIVRIVTEQANPQ